MRELVGGGCSQYDHSLRNLALFLARLDNNHPSSMDPELVQKHMEPLISVIHACHEHSNGCPDLAILHAWAARNTLHAMTFIWQWVAAVLGPWMPATGQKSAFVTLTAIVEEAKEMWGDFVQAWRSSKLLEGCVRLHDLEESDLIR